MSATSMPTIPTTPTMSAPSSADPLASLHDIHLPEAIGWWPPAPSWWFLAGTVIVVLATIFAWLRWRRLQANKAHIFSSADIIDAALLEFDGIAQQLDDMIQAPETDDSNGQRRQIVRAISQLLRRCAVQLNQHDSEHAAGLTGTAWLTWLDGKSDGQSDGKSGQHRDKHGQADDFTQGVGSMLIEAPYRNNIIKEDDVKALCSLSRTWLEQQR